MTGIRPIEPGDRAAWGVLFRAYGDFYETEFGDDVLDGVWAWLLDPRHEVSGLVAVDGAGDGADDGAASGAAGKLVGFAHIRRLSDTFTAGHGWFLDDLYVIAERRRQGIARDLIETAARDAAEAGGGTLRWITAADNTTAQNLYDRIATRATWVVYEREVEAAPGAAASDPAASDPAASDPAASDPAASDPAAPAAAAPDPEAS